MNKNLSNLGNRLSTLLRAARLDRGISLRELGRRAGTSHATLSAYEQGRKVPSVETFLRILEACGYAVDLHLSPRIRVADGVERGAELADALTLAAQVPARHDAKIMTPAFPHHA